MNITSKHGLFITLEGIEGVGKSTQIKFIQNYLTTKHIPNIVTREPGGTPIAEAIRRILLNPQEHEELLTKDSELLLLFAGRSQHIEHIIKPALAKKTWVICDRFTDASYAYQGGGRGESSEKIAFLEKWIQHGLYPDCVLLLDAPVDAALQRTKNRGKPDRIEAEEHDFFERVRETYLKRAKKFPERYKVIDANLTVEKVQDQIKQILDSMVSSYEP